MSSLELAEWMALFEVRAEERTPERKIELGDGLVMHLDGLPDEPDDEDEDDDAS